MRFVLLLIFSIVSTGSISFKDDGKLYDIILSDIDIEIKNRLPEDVPYFLITDYRVCLDDFYIRTIIDGGRIKNLEYIPDSLSINTYCTVEKIDASIINLSDNMKIVEYKDVMWFHEQRIYNLIDNKSKKSLPVRVIFSNVLYQNYIAILTVKINVGLSPGSGGVAFLYELTYQDRWSIKNKFVIN